MIEQLSTVENSFFDNNQTIVLDRVKNEYVKADGIIVDKSSNNSLEKIKELNNLYEPLNLSRYKILNEVESKKFEQIATLRESNTGFLSIFIKEIKYRFIIATIMFGYIYLLAGFFASNTKGDAQFGSLYQYSTDLFIIGAFLFVIGIFLLVVDYIKTKNRNHKIVEIILIDKEGAKNRILKQEKVKNLPWFYR